MAKEISANVKVSISSAGTSQAQGNLNWNEDLVGGCIGFEATIGSTTAAAISLGAGITNPKFVYIQNLDPGTYTPTPGNFVTVDAVVGLTAWPQKIIPGTAAILRPLNATIYAKADTAPVKVWIVAG